MSLHQKDKNPVFQPGGYGLRYDGQAEAIARAGEPPINYAPGQELSRAAPALPEHPTHGAARAFRDHLTGEYVVAAGPVEVRTRVSAEEAALLWATLTA